MTKFQLKEKLLQHMKTVEEWRDVRTAVKEIADRRRQSAEKGGDACAIS